MRCLLASLLFFPLRVAASATDEPDLDVILYGATGCVGGIAARHLAKQEGLSWAVAGRNASEVSALAEELCGAADTASCPKQIVAGLDENASTWVRRTRAVATAAGPFSVHAGQYLVEACARLGVHYVDTSDEFYWQREMIDRHDSVARSTGARVVLAGGFCALAGDLGAQLALAGAAGAGEEASVDSWLEKYNGGISAGVLNTMSTMKNASFPKEWETDPYVLAPFASESLKVDSDVTGLGKVGWDRHEGVVTQSLFGPYDARLLRRTFVLQGRAVHYRAGAPPGMYSQWAAFLAAHPGSWSTLTKCPTAAIQEDGSWQLRVRATASKGASRALLLYGAGDPGYRFTAVSLVEVALCLAGQVPGCIRASSQGGVQTSMLALEPDVLRKRFEAIQILSVGEGGDDDVGEEPVQVLV